MFIDINDLTNIINSDRLISNSIKYDWANLIIYRNLMYRGSQQQKGRWLTLDQLSETRQKYISCLNNVNHLSTIRHPWVIEYINIINSWLDENTIHIISFNSQNPGPICGILC